MEALREPPQRETRPHVGVVDARSDSTTSALRASGRVARESGVRDPTHALHERRLAQIVSQLLGTHAASALAGLASLPIVARNLGPAGYGEFSLFVLLLGVVTYQDFLRPLLIREWSSGAESGRRAELASLSLFTTGGVAALAALVGFVLLPPLAALAFAVAAAANSLASVDHARLAAAGRVGLAGSVRNLGFASALAIAMALSFLARDGGLDAVHVYAWPFAVANVAVFLVKRRMTKEPLAFRFDAGTRREARAAFRAHRGTIVNLMAFGVATAVVVSTDRVILDHVVDAETFGAYAGCADLAVKLTVVGTALGTALYPALSRSYALDPREATRRFVRIATLVMCGWFAVILGLVTWHREIVSLVLGPRFEAGHALYAWILVGSFVHMLGFLLTPWQRARGEFGRQTRAYALAGAVMIAVGLVTIPWLGVVGAVACYLASRSAEVMILGAELSDLRADVLPRWKLATLAAMAATIGYAAYATSGGAA